MWHKDVSVEQMLTEIGIPFSYKVGIQIRQLQIKESLRNNARMSLPLDEDVVAKYAHDMSRGVSFPAPVITGNGFLLSGNLKNKVGDGFVFAGNQRTNAAMKAGWTTVDAYVVPSCSEEQMDDFIRRDNTRHGKTTSEEEKIQACVWLHRKHGRSLKELCFQYFGDNTKLYARIVNANMARTVADRLLERHIQANLPQSSLVVMNPIPDSNVLCETYRLASDYGLNAAEIDGLVSDVCAKKSESERLAVVVSKKGELDHRVRSGTVRPDVLLRKHLSSFRNFLANGYEGGSFPPIDKIVSDKKQRLEYKTVIDQVLSSLKALKEKS